ncbi:MAG: hypothetical protein IJ191_09790 [Treponema sp.]|nr:hypothetical protein [Treponema sp.]
MKKKFLTHTKRLLITGVLSVGVATVVGTVILALVWLLWLWATRVPAVYTGSVILFFTAFIVWRVVRVIRQTPLHSCITVAAQIGICLGGIGVSVLSVLHGHRFGALLLLLATGAALVGIGRIIRAHVSR